MPVNYTLFPQENWIDLTACEEVGETEIRHAFETYIADTRFRPGMHVLVDLQNATLKANSGIVHNFVELLAANQKKRGKNYRIALLVTQGFQETMSHLFSMYAKNQPVECRVFKERSAALEWLLEKKQNQANPAV